jgi:hypothetical protein
MRAVGFVVAMGLAASWSGCGAPVDADLKGCPCAAGYVCCDTGVCAADEQACAGSDAALFGLFKGDWEGYLENFQFRSGSDALSLSLSVSEAGVPSAQVVLGAGTPPPAPRATDAFWPPVASDGELTALLTPALEGVTYTAENLRWEQQRLRFTINPFEPWQRFCELQPIFPVAGGYQCLPERVSGDANGGCRLADSGEEVDCRRASLCDAGPGAVCACTAAECHADSIRTIAFDLALRQGAGDGTTSIGNTLVNVRLRRQ